MRQKTPIERVGVALTSSLDPRVDVDVDRDVEEKDDQRARPDPDSPFRILVLGDFSGRGSRGVRNPEDLGVDRFPVRVDRDSLDTLPERLGARAAIQLVKNGPFLDIGLRRIEDFHPDRLFEGTAAFAGLRRTRLDLQNPETFERGAAEVRSWERLKEGGGFSPDSGSADEGASPAAEGAAAAEGQGEELVRELLERSESNEDNPENAFNRFVQQVLQPYQADDGAADRDELIERTDDAIGSWMRDLLHHTRWQALEASWRGLEFLLRRLEADEPVEVHVLDVTREELADSLRSAPDLSRSAIHELFVASGSWSLFAGLFTFDRSLEDVALLGRLAKVASAAGAPFLAAGSPAILEPDSEPSPPVPGRDEDDEAEVPTDEALWAALRDLPESGYLGLALPRFLLRLPYGADTDPLEVFPFEEMKDGGGRRALLWGNPAIACALLIAQGFESGGWRFHPGQVRDLESLPLYMAEHRGETVATPCAETLLSDDVAQTILERGLMPLVSLRGRDAIRLPRFQSIASPSRPLDGPWERGRGRKI